MGDLVPILLEEVVPGDKFKVNTESLVRLAPMVAPMMHRVNIFTHFFFVPNRLTWDGWEDFITGGPDGLDQSTLPLIDLNATNAANFKKGSLGDYFGLPLMDGTITNPAYVNALPFRAYQMIYNEYYRDQNLTDPIEFTTGAMDPLDIPRLAEMRKRAWEKDYFTSALPWAQRGNPVGIPVDFNYKNATEVYNQNDLQPTIDKAVHTGQVGTTDGLLYPQGSSDPEDVLRLENLEEEATSVDINELRKAVKLQEWLEKNARAGSRYIEQIFSHFGVKSSDARLQRPEYLGGGKNPVVISEVLQTSATNTQDTAVDASVQGNMAGHGISVGRSNNFSRRFEEHGFIIGIMSVLPRTAYQQGFERFWHKYDKFDYYWPEFAHLGEQEVITHELYHNFAGTANESKATFGYQSRYSEYKYKQSMVHSDFRESLNYWHMGRIFENLPVLNTEFVESDPTTRVFAVEEDGTDKLYVQLYNNVRAIRPMPVFGTPRL